MGYKVLEPVDPQFKKINPIATGIDLDLAKANLANTHIKLVATKADLKLQRLTLLL